MHWPIHCRTTSHPCWHADGKSETQERQWYPPPEDDQEMTVNKMIMSDNEQKKTGKHKGDKKDEDKGDDPHNLRQKITQPKTIT